MRASRRSSDRDCKLIGPNPFFTPFNVFWPLTLCLTFGVHSTDTPRGAGGLKVGPPQRRSPAEFRRRAKARLCEQFRTVRLFHPWFLVRGCIGGLAPVQSPPWRRRNGGSRRSSPDIPARKIRGFRFFIR